MSGSGGRGGAAGATSRAGGTAGGGGGARGIAAGSVVVGSNAGTVGSAGRAGAAGVNAGTTGSAGRGGASSGNAGNGVAGASGTGGGPAVPPCTGPPMFTVQRFRPGLLGTMSIAIGDVDGDSRPDLVVTTGTTTPTILVNQGGGGFVYKTYAEAVVQFGVGMVLGDVDRDGKLDLAIGGKGQVKVVRGGGDGTFLNPNAVTYPVGGGGTEREHSGSGLAMADLNADGWPDLAVTNYATAGSVGVLINNRDGTFAAQVAYPTEARPDGLVAADLDGDGKLDLAVGHASNAGGLAVLRNNGDGTFGGRVVYPSSAVANAIAAGDVNGDRRIDLAVASEVDDTLTVYLNSGNGSFTGGTPFAAGADPSSVVLADLNGDGRLDIAVTSRTGLAVRVLLGDGTGRFGAATSFAVPTGQGAPDPTLPRFLTVADLDADGRPDLAAATMDDWVSVFFNTCTP